MIGHLTSKIFTKDIPPISKDKCTFCNEGLRGELSICLMCNHRIKETVEG